MQKYGQHFLINQGVIEQITQAALAMLPARLLEIGPGKGALTQKLIAGGAKDFTVVEIDPEMAAFLQTHLPPQAGVHIVQSDFLTFDLNALSPEPTAFVSNLPYIDAADILDKTLSYPHFKSAVYMFQKEQANRVLAAAGGEFYGPLSVLSQLRSRVSRLCNVGRGSFNPPPKVESTVLCFERLQTPVFASAEEYLALKKLVTAAFAHKRKTLLNSLALCGYEPARTADALQNAGLAPAVRAEKVSPQQFVAFVRAL